MRNIEVTAKSVDQAIEKGMQMLGVSREEIEVKVLNEGSMLKKAVVEIYTFATPEEREEYLKNNKPKKEVEEKPLPIVDYFRELELRVQSHLGRRVKIEEKGRKKTITLSYEDNEDLDELLRTICGADFLEEI
jgi:predicted RNA-binding protein Jag